MFIQNWKKNDDKIDAIPINQQTIKWLHNEMSVINTIDNDQRRSTNWRNCGKNRSCNSHFLNWINVLWFMVMVWIEKRSNYFMTDLARIYRLKQVFKDFPYSFFCCFFFLLRFLPLECVSRNPKRMLVWQISEFLSRAQNRFLVRFIRKVLL